MIVWLDNQDNHTGASTKIMAASSSNSFRWGWATTAKAHQGMRPRLTGWTIGNTEYMVLRSDAIPTGHTVDRVALRRRSDDHDAEEKTFLGQTARLTRRHYRDHLSAGIDRALSRQTYVPTFLLR